MRRLWCLVVIGVLAVAVSVVGAGPAVAAKGGNSENAHACQQGGHQNRFEAKTGNPFKNAGDCVNDGAQGTAYASLSIDQGGSPYSCFAGRCWGHVVGDGLLPGAAWEVQEPITQVTLAHGTVTPSGGTNHETLNLACTFTRAQISSTTSGGASISVIVPNSVC